MKALLLALFALPALALAQGALTPSDAPAPTMKSLDQLEARVPIGKVGGSTSNLTIGKPGSYVLVGNVTVSSGNGITISGNNITLDLNGFTISSNATSPTGYGVFVGNVRQIVIENGHIRGSGTITNGEFDGTGFSGGVYVGTVSAKTVTIRNVTVREVGNFGIKFSGPFDSDTGVVEHCQVHTCGTTGIEAPVVRDCTADNCGETAINASRTFGCFGKTVGQSNRAHGISAIDAVDCTGTANAGVGISVSGSATNCHGTSSTYIGLRAIAAIGCRGRTVSGVSGISVTLAANCLGENDAGGIGLRADIANTCAAASGTVSVTHKYNMP